MENYLVKCKKCNRIFLDNVEKGDTVFICPKCDSATFIKDYRKTTVNLHITSVFE